MTGNMVKLVSPFDPSWRIACNFVGKGHRRQGVATAALAALSTYEKLGFVRYRKIGKHRWVVTKVVTRTS